MKYRNEMLQAAVHLNIGTGAAVTHIIEQIEEGNLHILPWPVVLFKYIDQIQILTFGGSVLYS